MIVQREGESRRDYLIRVAIAYLTTHGDYTIDYDETTCDGQCLAEELAAEFDLEDWT